MLSVANLTRRTSLIALKKERRRDKIKGKSHRFFKRYLRKMGKRGKVTNVSLPSVLTQYHHPRDHSNNWRLITLIKTLKSLDNVEFMQINRLSSKWRSKIPSCSAFEFVDYAGKQMELKPAVKTGEEMNCEFKLWADFLIFAMSFAYQPATSIACVCCLHVIVITRGLELCCSDRRRSICRLNVEASRLH